MGKSLNCIEQYCFEGTNFFVSSADNSKEVEAEERQFLQAEKNIT